MFVSDGKQVSENWITYAESFAETNGGKVVHLACGHYIHYYESDRISTMIREFVNDVS